jgi:hypothetical protein
MSQTNQRSVYKRRFAEVTNLKSVRTVILPWINNPELASSDLEIDKVVRKCAWCNQLVGISYTNPTMDDIRRIDTQITLNEEKNNILVHGVMCCHHYDNSRCDSVVCVPCIMSNTSRDRTKCGNDHFVPWDLLVPVGFKVPLMLSTESQASVQLAKFKMQAEMTDVKNQNKILQLQLETMRNYVNTCQSVMGDMIHHSDNKAVSLLYANYLYQFNQMNVTLADVNYLQIQKPPVPFLDFKLFTHEENFPSPSPDKETPADKPLQEDIPILTSEEWEAIMNNSLVSSESTCK